MRCQRCGAAIRERVAFCDQCGASLNGVKRVGIFCMNFSWSAQGLALS